MHLETGRSGKKCLPNWGAGKTILSVCAVGIGALLAGALYGLIDEWIRRGMQELPDNFCFRTIIQTYAGQEMHTP